MQWWHWILAYWAVGFAVTILAARRDTAQSEKIAALNPAAITIGFALIAFVALPLQACVLVGKGIQRVALGKGPDSGYAPLPDVFQPKGEEITPSREPAPSMRTPLLCGECEHALTAHGFAEHGVRVRDGCQFCNCEATPSDGLFAARESEGFTYDKPTKPTTPWMRMIGKQRGRVN